MTGSLAVLLVIFGIIALMAIHSEIDWRYRQSRKPRMLTEPPQAAAEHEAMLKAISDTKGQS